jgi:patatin-like phospholipase/acyl hydrolase
LAHHPGVQPQEHGDDRFFAPSRRFQILALDGGGFRGVFSAAVLASFVDDLGLSVLDQFDLVAGTSTGGIIALALSIGMLPKEVLEFYLSHGPQIFKGRWLRWWRQPFRSKYGPQGLAGAVFEVFGEKRLWEAKVPLCIPSYDLCSDDVYLFRTPHSERLKRDYRERMIDVAMATSAAPTYLPSHHHDGLRLIDGGIWANNPSVVAVSEAVSEFGIALTDIRVLSLGTTSELGEKAGSLDRGGLLRWARSATPMILNGQTRGAENAAFHLLPKGQLVRVNPKVPENVLSLDAVNPAKLIGLAKTESRKQSKDVEAVFGGHRAGQYTPYHTT